VVRLVIAAAIVVLAVVIAQWLQQRRRADVPTQPRRHVPSQLDRNDFVHPQRPWLLVVFASEVCTMCADVFNKAMVLESPQVAVQKVGYEGLADLHRRYQIDSVPTLVIVDQDGVVSYGNVGPISATDLWAAMAKARNPNLQIAEDGCGGHQPTEQ
jgi:thioredoxin-related protein